MNSEQLKHITAKTFDHLIKLMESKGAEYQGETSDRLGNFKRGAESTGVRPLTVLHVYMSKHWDSFSTYVRDQQLGRDRKYSEPIEGRLDDIINYALLAKALIHEANQPEQAGKADIQAIAAHEAQLRAMARAEGLGQSTNEAALGLRDTRIYDYRTPG